MEDTVLVTDRLHNVRLCMQISSLIHHDQQVIMWWNMHLEWHFTILYRLHNNIAHTTSFLYCDIKTKDITLLQPAVFSDILPQAKKLLITVAMWAEWHQTVGNLDMSKNNRTELYSYTFPGLTIRWRHWLHALDTCNLSEMPKQGCSWATVIQGGALVLFWVLGATSVLPLKAIVWHIKMSYFQPLKQKHSFNMCIS